MSGYYKPRAEIQLRVPPWNSRGDTDKDVVWSPKIISMKWHRNNHKVADELMVTVHYTEGGVDPRMIKHARCSMWMWDQLREDFDENDHLRFVGICKKAHRKLTKDGMVVELTFHDYTTFFLMMKPFPTDGMPLYTDTLKEIWNKIIKYTGYRDRDSVTPDNPTGIKSNVTALRDNIQFVPAELADRTLGSMVSDRFHAIARPSPPNRCDAWAVWQWCCASLGLVSQIAQDRCIVTPYSEFFTDENAPSFMYGENILDIEESVDTHVAKKGILGKSFDPLAGRLLESAYPSPDDPFIKRTKASVKRVLKGKANALNEASAEYEEFNFPWITTQEGLDTYVRATWEEFSRQEIKGKLTTVEMGTAVDYNGNSIPYIDYLKLGAGDCIRIQVNGENYEAVKALGSINERVQFLMERCGYTEPVAILVAKNIGDHILASPIYHVETLSVEYSDGKFQIEIEYHNRVELTGEYNG